MVNATAETHAFSLKISSSKSFGIKGKISDAVKKNAKRLCQAILGNKRRVCLVKTRDDVAAATVYPLELS